MPKKPTLNEFIPRCGSVTYIGNPSRYCERPATTLIMEEGTGVIHHRCEEHTGTFILAVFTLTPTAKIMVRNPHTWHRR